MCYLRVDCDKMRVHIATLRVPTLCDCHGVLIHLLGFILDFAAKWDDITLLLKTLQRVSISEQELKFCKSILNLVPNYFCDLIGHPVPPRPWPAAPPCCYLNLIGQISNSLHSKHLAYSLPSFKSFSRLSLLTGIWGTPILNASLSSALLTLPIHSLYSACSTSVFFAGLFFGLIFLVVLFVF